ncbi:MAG: AbrB/MazE/SpoVT family DNA-binding domain-containing protein [Candidatus Hodarchaeota archaeon]
MAKRVIQNLKTNKGSSLYVVLPKDLCSALQWNEGDIVEFTFHEGKLLVDKVGHREKKKGK